jgi:putative peptide zinc metalloprotease protein
MSIDEVEVSTPQAAARVLASPSSAPQEAPPRLAAGVELIGEFEDSGFKQPPYIARRADGQVVQMPRLLFALAEQIDGKAGLEEVAERYSQAIERHVQPQDVRMLITERLVPLGVAAAGPGAESVELGKVDPLLALKFRTAVVPERAVRLLTAVFQPLFWGPAMLVAVLGFIGLDGWLFFVHGVSQSLRHVLYQPALMLMLIGGVVLATACHEIGHATACRYGGASPGVMGVGVYIVWPAFYTDITDAYRLGKWGRLRTDVGGMYFNALFALVVGAAYALTSFEPLLLLIVLQTFAIIQQALPLLRLDGYYILSDLTGVPDIYLRIRAVLASLIPGRTADPRVSELRPWVRTVVTLYVVAMVLFLGFVVLGLVINLPRVLATGYDSATLHLQAVGPDFRQGRGPKGVLDVIEMLFLALPAAGLVFTALRIGRRAGGGALRWSSAHPARRVVLAVGTGGLVTVAALSWWPNGEYRPIQPGERGTLEGLFKQIQALPSARPSLTALRQQQLGGAPTERQRPRTAAGSSSRSSHRPGALNPAGSTSTQQSQPGDAPQTTTSTSATDATTSTQASSTQSQTLSSTSTAPSSTTMTTTATTSTATSTSTPTATAATTATTATTSPATTTTTTP